MIENVKETLQKYLDRLIYDDSQYRKEALLYYPLADNPSIENINTVKNLILEHEKITFAISIIKEIAKDLNIKLNDSQEKHHT